VTYNDPAIIELDDAKASLLPIERRIFQGDMTKEELAKVAPFTPPTVQVDQKKVMEGVKSGLEALWAEVHRTQQQQQQQEQPEQPPSRQKDELETVQGLIERIGKVEIAYPNHSGPEPRYNRTLREHLQNKLKL